MATSTPSMALAKRSLDTSLMLPPPSPPKRIKRPAKVLDEDDYTDALSHIIARDFFPGLLETKSKQEYLDALDSHDHEWIATAGSRLTEVMTPGPDGRRFRGKRGTSLATPTGIRATDIPKAWQGDTPISVVSSASTKTSTKPEKPEVNTNMSLGAFQQKYTSEDNESFYKLLDKQNQKKREKYAWRWANNKIPAARQIAHRKRERLVADNKLSEENESGQELARIEPADTRQAMPDTWPLRPENALMFAPQSIEDKAQTVVQRSEEASVAPPKAVVYDNTRISHPSATLDISSDIPPSPSLSAVKDALAGRPRPTETEASFAGASTPRVNGYAFVDSEEPESPSRLSSSSTLLLGSGDSTPNPFKLHESSRREALHHRMVDKVAKGKRAAIGKRAVEVKTPSMTPRFLSSPRTEKKGGLTPAAERLMGNTMSTLQGAPNYSFYAIPAFYVLVLFPEFYGRASVIRANNGKFDNANPRGEKFATSLRKTLPNKTLTLFERAKAAHQNGLESLPLFAAAVICANIANVDTETLNTICAAFLILRAVYIPIYLNITNHTYAWARTGVWAASTPGASDCGSIVHTWLCVMQRLRAEASPSLGARDPSDIKNGNQLHTTNIPAFMRPSSRVSNTMPVHGPVQNPDLPREESYEEQLQRATAMSLTDSQTLPGQEMGVTYQNPYFGPANQAHYDSEKWAMTLPEAHTQEIVLNPEPPDRKRKPGTPAFFRPSSSGHGLSAFIKILHEIPMAREALLNRGHLLGDYGRETDWWDGTPVKVLHVVNVDQHGQETGSDDVIYETQRLMAFLEQTERAYGSIDVLVSLHNISAFTSDIFGTYLNVWKDATQNCVPDMPLVNTFTSKGVQRQSVEPREADIFSLSVKIGTEVGGKGMTLYEAIDDFLWADAEEAEVFLAEVGDVITFEVENQCPNLPGLGIRIPAVWYADRYLESSIQAAYDMKARKAAINAEARDVNRVQELMTQYRKPDSGTTLGADDLLNKVTTYFQQTAAYRVEESAEADVEDSESQRSSLGRIMEELITLTKRVSTKLDEFQSIRDSTLDRMREISKLYTEPSNDPDKPPKHKYTLRGVMSNPNIVYVLEKETPEEDEDMLGSRNGEWKWWRLEYMASSINPIITTKVTESQVLDAASNDSYKALLVYASERAVSYEIEPLPPQLHNFVRTDNIAFAAELDAFKSTAATADASPTSTQKRKASSSSDLEVEFPRSPPADRSHSPPSSASSSLDSNPPDSVDGILGRGTSPPHMTRPLAPTMRSATSSDDRVPLSLHVEDAGQEMQESGHGGMLRGMGDSYKLGSYVPEISMDDEDEGYVEDSEDEKRPRG
ncbi:MAG: hypothetical protein Q9217_002646 [Psora testacea]